MMRDWIELSTAAGINVRSMNSMDVFLLAGKILNDRQLVDLGSRFGIVNRIEAIKSLSAQERLALRERVTGVVPVSR